MILGRPAANKDGPPDGSPRVSEFAFKMMDFVFKMMDFAFKMVDFGRTLYYLAPACVLWQVIDVIHQAPACSTDLF